MGPVWMPSEPLGCSGIVSDYEGFHRHTKVWRPCESGAEEVFDLFLAAMHSTRGDIFVDTVVGENGVGLFRLVEGPSSIKLIHQATDLLRRSGGHVAPSVLLGMHG